jgi:hypothetical protein
VTNLNGCAMITTDNLLEMYMYKLFFLFFIFLVGCSSNSGSSSQTASTTKDMVSSDVLSTFKELNQIVAKGKAQ